jgi:LysR family nitrogen assimilation transcriptional regulator
MELKYLLTGIEFRHLRTVVAVAEAGSITKAAKLLHTAQPGLSTQLQQLEHILGSDLFVRTPKGMQLTESGEQFLVHAKSILKYFSHAVSELKSSSKQVSGSFTIGCANSLANTIGANLMMSLKHRFPKLLPSIQALGGTALQQSVVAAELDFYITSSIIELIKDDGDIVHSARNASFGSSLVEDVARERFLICLPSDNETNSGVKGQTIMQELPVNILETAPICLFSEDHGISKIIDWLADKHDLDITHYGYTNNTEIMVDLVLSGQCIVVLPSSFSKLFTRRPNLRFHPLRGYHIQRDIVLCYSNDLEVSDTTRLVKELVLEVLRTALSHELIK